MPMYQGVTKFVCDCCERETYVNTTDIYFAIKILLKDKNWTREDVNVFYCDNDICKYVRENETDIEDTL